MKSMPREAWSYALLLIILFAIASLAASQTISFLHDKLPQTQYQVAAAAIWSLTLGFMLIAGAFGLWATQFAAEAESRRRISSLVQAMDYIRDGLVAMDPRGRVTGANTAARRIAGREVLDGEPLREAFDCLTEVDLQTLTHRAEPREVERTVLRNATLTSYRFRSQPSAGMTLVLISDVTTMQEQQARSRQAAHLQLVGQLAHGVANDFNDLLSIIAGHASVLDRLAPALPGLQESTHAITAASERGVALADKLLSLSKAVPRQEASRRPGVHVQNAADALRNVLPGTWQVESDSSVFSSVPLTGTQLEQIILNLGMLAADDLGQPGRLTITARPPDSTDPPQTRECCSCLLLIRSSRSDTPETRMDAANLESRADSGILLSVIRSMVAETGGSLDSLDQEYLYRLCLPRRDQETETEPETAIEPLGTYLRNGAVLLAVEEGENTSVEKVLRQQQVRVERADDIVSILGRIESSETFDILVLDAHLAGQELSAVLRAVSRLQPTLGILVLTDSEDARAADAAPHIRFIEEGSDASSLLVAMIECRSAAASTAEA